MTLNTSNKLDEEYFLNCYTYMKELIMKQYLIGLLTGCLLTFSVLVFMGANENEKEVGRYQMSSGGKNNTPLLVDTTNGRMYKFNDIRRGWNKMSKPIQNPD